MEFLILTALLLVASGCMAIDCLSNGFDRDGKFEGDLPLLRYSARLVLCGATCASQLACPCPIHLVILFGSLTVASLVTYKCSAGTSGACECRTLAMLTLSAAGVCISLTVGFQDVARGLCYLDM